MKQRKKPHGFSPHHHTGHVLPRHRTSFPVLAMILLCTGVFLASWTRVVTADVVTYSLSDSYVVKASVPGPPPSVAATIDNPNSGDKFSATPISVSGTCPADTYVVLYRNNVMSGVSLCDALGKWHVTTDLFVGVNNLKAIVYSFTDVAGPDSNIVSVTYQPPAAVSPTSPPAGGTTKPATRSPEFTAPGVQPLTIKSDFTFQGYYVGSEIVWQLIVDGGDPPYAIAVDWGDGTHGLASRSASGSIVFKHTYKKPGGYNGSYAPIFTATDDKGQQTTLQLLSIVSNRPSEVPVGSSDQGYTISGLAAMGGKALQQFVKYIWPSYFIVVLMLISYWLGERREYHILRPGHRKTVH